MRSKQSPKTRGPLKKVPKAEPMDAEEQTQNGSDPLATYKSFKSNRLRWYHFPRAQKKALLTKALAMKPKLACIGRCNKPLPSSVEGAVAHLDDCFLTEYFRYIDRIEEFRKLDKTKVSSILRGVVSKTSPMPCLNINVGPCQMSYISVPALQYHLDRCGADPEKAPWRCYRCGYSGMKSESQFHLNECANRDRLRHLQEEQEKRQRQLLLANSPLGDGMRPLPKVNYAETDGAVQSTSSDEPALKRRREDSPEFDPRAALEEEAEEGELPANLPSALLAELGANAAMASSPTRIRQRPTELTPQSYMLSPTRTFKPRAYASVANATLPLSGCRVRITEEGTRRYKFKISDPVASERRPSTMDVRRYLKSVHSARETFYREAATKSLSPALLPECFGDIKWARAAPRAEMLRWKDTSSVSYSTTFTEQPQKKKGKTKKMDNVEVNTQDASSDVPLESIPFLRCVELEFDVDVDVPRAFESLQVADLAADVSAPTVSVPPPGEIALSEHREQLLQFKEQKRQRETGHMLFCGGPISALKTCPRKLPNGNELVALTTFSDEKVLVPSDQAVTYIQFWSFASDLSTLARPSFFIEVPAPAVTELCWCPLITEEFFRHMETSNNKANGQPSSSKEASGSSARTDQHAAHDVDSDVLGYLAAATTTGRIFIYWIPKDVSSLEDSTDASLPPIYSVEPLFTLRHLPIGRQDVTEAVPQTSDASTNEDPSATDTDGGESVSTSDAPPRARQKASRTIDAVPFISMDWSHFLRGRFIGAISATNQIYIWDLEAKEDVGAPLIVLSPSGPSPAVTISWLADYEVCVSFRAKMLKVFDINSGDCILAEQTTRTAGAKVATQPVCFNGLLAYDTHFINIVDVMNTMSSYIAFNRDDDSAIVVPTFNSHQVQACRSRICQRTGAIGSVGADGRLVWSINGRIVARGETMDYTFACARPALHLIRRHKIPANVDETVDKVLLSHEESCEGSWLEVRLGDNALKDQDSVKRNKLKLPEIQLDRRVESLTSMDFSHITPGLTVAGGEAGIVFILPCFL